jgi:hypothetical protein
MQLEQTDVGWAESACRALVPLQISIEDLGRAILADIEEGDQARDRADQVRSLADEKYMSAGLRLIEVRNRVRDFSGFLRDHCGGFSRSRAYELIAFAEGKGDKVRANARARDRRRRENAAGVRGSRTRGVSVKKPEPAKTEAQRALAEFKYAVDTWFTRMDDATKGEAVAYAIGKGKERCHE